MTIILAIMHSRSENPNFDPLGLYLDTLILDLAIIESITLLLL